MLPIGILVVLAIVFGVIALTGDSSSPKQTAVAQATARPRAGPLRTAGPTRSHAPRPTTPPGATELSEYRAGMPAVTLSRFDLAYSAGGYDPQEELMGRLLYGMANRNYYVADDQVPDVDDARFLIERFPAGITAADYTYLSELLGVHSGAPVLRTKQAKTSVIGSAVFSCFRDAMIFSPFVFLTDGEITSYKKCVRSGRVLTLAQDSVAEAAPGNASLFADRIMNCLSPSLAPVGSIMVVLVPQETSLTDLAEFAYLREQLAADGQVYNDHRGVAAYGVAAVGEENVLDLNAVVDTDGLKVGQTVVHEIAHLIMDSNPMLAGEASAVYEHSMRAGLWEDTYEALNPQEFFAVLTTIMFGLGHDSPAEDAAGLRIIGLSGPQELKDYDPEVYAFFSRIYPCISSAD